VKASAARDRCFAPIADRNARTLILGSLPGRKSLEMQQYYAHPQNAFWKLMAAVFEWDPESIYAQRVRLLKQNGVALWDVCAAAERPGSLDSAIVSATANDFATFYRKHPGIDRVFFNGRKSEEIFRRSVLPRVAAEFPYITYAGLPSTSPAHAGMSFSKKVARWREIRDLR
jgi:double-stranded uracil-DNA glycosylase